MNAINLYNNLYEFTENTTSKKNIKAICKFIPTKLKNEYWNIEPYKNPESNIINKIVLKTLNGLDIWNKWIKPVVPVKRTANAFTRESGKENDHRLVHGRWY